MTGITAAIPYGFSALAQIKWRIADQKKMETPRFIRDMIVAGPVGGVLGLLHLLLAQHRAQLLGLLGSVPADRRRVPARHPGLQVAAPPDDRHPVKCRPTGERSYPSSQSHGRRPRAVVALGGNALLATRRAARGGEPRHGRPRAPPRLLARVASTHRLVVTHGNGPQVGLLALMSDAYTETAPYPLDVLGSETEGQIGYVLELALDNAIPTRRRSRCSRASSSMRRDPAFSAPVEVHRPGLLARAEARSLAERHGWTVKRDGQDWRRVVPSPEPQRIVQLGAIERLVDAGFLVVCTGGGGIPVVEDRGGHQRGVEAVIDKDLASALLASDLRVDTLVLATDVDAVYDDYGTPVQRPIARATPARASTHTSSRPGRWVRRSRRCAASSSAPAAARRIGSLDEIDELLSGPGRHPGAAGRSRTAIRRKEGSR